MNTSGIRRYAVQATDWIVAEARRLHPAGLTVALVFYMFSLTPSLLPRTWYLQAVATALSMAAGYGIGVLGAWIVRKAGFDRPPPAAWRRVGWWALAAAAAICVPLFLWLGARWQRSIRQSVGVPVEQNANYLYLLFLAVALTILLLEMGRGLRHIADILTRTANKVVPAPAARLTALVLLIVLAVQIAEGGVTRLVLAGATIYYESIDDGTREGVVRPTDPERSGAPASAEAWESLGRDGRSFVAGGPSAEQIEGVTGQPAVTPIRAYAGRASAETIPEIADRVVAELQRTGGFERRVLAVATTTGRGWVNVDAAASLEYITGGNSAIAAMQYSYLQSPFAFLADRETPQEAGRVLLEKVYEVWRTLPEEQRPTLLVFGESLGSYGAQAAFSSVYDMEERIDGALFIGTPNFSEPWRRLTDSRDLGSSEQRPVVDGGRIVRFAAEPDDLDLPRAWGQPRVVYWQHPNDPIVWWSPDLLLDEPAWLSEPLDPVLNPAMRWFPVVTFWQVTLDMVFAVGVPPGNGHAYGTPAADYWVDILQPEGWQPSDTERIRQALVDPDAHEDELSPLPTYR